jgi:hypothetical protein
MKNVTNRALLGLFFYPENGGDMFLRNVIYLSTNYTALYPRRENSSENYCLQQCSGMEEGRNIKQHYE